MGLIDRLRGRPGRPQLMLPSAYGHTLGHYVPEDAYARGKEALRQLKRLPNADDADVDALVRTVNEVIKLGQEVAEIDEALEQGSSYELDSLLSADDLVADSYRSGYDPHPREIAYGRLRLDYVQDSLRHWVAANLPAPQDGDMLALIVRRGDLLPALITAHQGLLRTTAEIERAHHKLEIITAAGRLDLDAGRDGVPDLAIARSQESEQRISAVSAGLDAAYTAALERRPDLQPLGESPAQALGSRSQAGPELD